MGIFNLLSTSEFIAGTKKMKEEIFMAIEQNTAELKASVDRLVGRVNDLVGPLQDANATLVTTLAAEREAAAALNASEEAEDVEQNRALADAQAATDEALRVQDAAAAEIAGLTTEVDAVFAAPVVEEPATAEPEAPAVETPAEPEAPAAEEPAAETPAVDEPVVEEPAVLPDVPVTEPEAVETPADDADVADAPATDEDGNPTVV
jgi:hypothetical protein